MGFGIMELSKSYIYLSFLDISSFENTPALKELSVVSKLIRLEWVG